MADVYVREDVRVTAAQLAGRSREMDMGAQRVLASVRAVALNYVDTGKYIDAFGIVTVPGERGTGRTVKDRLIYNDDPAALPQEYGYIRRLSARRVQYVPGRHIMRRGLERAQ